MSSPNALPSAPPFRQLAAEVLREEGATWLFVAKAALSLCLTGWLAMRLALPQPTTAMLTSVIVMNRQTGMVLAKSFYRALGTVAGALAALLMMSLFPQERVLFLLALALWVGLCAGGAMLYRNFKSYGFVLAGYTAAIVGLPVIDAPLNAFASAVARVSEVLLGILVAGVVSDTLFPSRMRDALRRAAREQFAQFMDFIGGSMGGAIPREAMELAHLRFVRAAITLEDLRSSVIFEDAETRARSGHLQLFNQRFMAASTSFQSLHHLIDRLQHIGHQHVAAALIALYRPIGEALDVSTEAGVAARVLLPRLAACRERMAAEATALRAGLDGDEGIDFDTGASLLLRFADELYAYAEVAATLQAPKLAAGAVEKVRFVRGNEALTAVHTAATMLALSIFWIASAWPSGSGAMLIAAVMCGLFASAPNPTRQAVTMLIGWGAGIVACFVCEFFVLPQMDGYGLLVAGILPFFVIGPYLSMRPSLIGVGVGYGMGFVNVLSLSNPMVFDPVRFMNDAVSQIVGLGAAVIAFAILPAAGARWLHRRQFDQLRHQVALAAEAPLPGLLYRFESVNRDLFQQIVARTIQGSTGSRALLAWALAVHETGRALIELRQTLADSHLAEVYTASVHEVVQSLARFYEHPNGERYLAARQGTLAAIAVVQADAAAQPALGQVLGHLHLIRMGLLDGESVIAEYMPEPAEIPLPPATENRDHAP